MENSALNKAHQQFRQAEALLRSRKFLDSIECHQKAAELLSEALTCTGNVRSIESIRLQRDFHIRQKDIILAQKAQYEKRNSEKQKRLPDAIYQTFEKTDSLLVLLKNDNVISDVESLNSESTDRDQGDGSAPTNIKLAKDKQLVVEELRLLNEQLHSHVYILVEQLEEKDKEICDLRDRIKLLESDQSNKVKLSSNNLHATDSSGGISPYVFTPSNELSPVIGPQHPNSNQELTLAPLDLPVFEFSTILSNYNSMNFG